MKQPRVPEYREGDSVSKYIKSLILFLKDFSMSVWRETQNAAKEIEGIEYPVTSVNGKTGEVKLAAADVGALANTGGTLNGVLKISRTSSIAEDKSAEIVFSNTQTDNNVTTGSAYIRVYDDHDVDTYGQNMVIRSAGNMVIGAGESPSNCYSADLVGDTGEVLYLTADNGIHFYSNANTYANKKVATFDKNGVFNAPTLSEGGTKILLKAWPVGSVYMSANSTSPASLFGGTWTQLKDRFLIGAGGSYAVNATGGATTHTLKANEMPVHDGHIQGDARPDQSLVTNGTIVKGRYLGNLSGDNTSNEYGWVINHGNEGYPAALNAGGGKAHNNMPPYLAVYMWKRTA